MVLEERASSLLDQSSETDAGMASLSSRRYQQRFSCLVLGAGSLLRLVFWLLLCAGIVLMVQGALDIFTSTWEKA